MEELSLAVVNNNGVSIPMPKQSIVSVRLKY